MASIQEARISGLMSYLPAAVEARVETYKQVFEENRHRIYSLAFWMTDNELAAEELMGSTFIRAFASSPTPDAEAVDRALVTELRELMPLGPLTLECSPATEVLNVRGNVKRVHLERSLMRVPVTERVIFLMHDVENYEHARIARTLGISEEESRSGLHQARLHLRELLAAAKD